MKYESTLTTEDMQGNLFPEVTTAVTDPYARMIDLICDLAGSEGEFADRARDILTVMEGDRLKQEWGNTPIPWDLKDEDGDYHSPTWYLDAYMTSRENYREAIAHGVDSVTYEAEQIDMQRRDDLLEELEMYEVYVNRLFNK